MRLQSRGTEENFSMGAGGSQSSAAAASHSPDGDPKDRAWSWWGWEKKRALPLRPRFAPDGNSGFSGGAGDGSGRDEDFEGGDSSNSCCFRRELTGYVL